MNSNQKALKVLVDYYKHDAIYASMQNQTLAVLDYLEQYGTILGYHGYNQRDVIEAYDWYKLGKSYEIIMGYLADKGPINWPFKKPQEVSVKVKKSTFYDFS